VGRLGGGVWGEVFCVLGGFSESVFVGGFFLGSSARGRPPCWGETVSFKTKLSLEFFFDPLWRGQKGKLLAVHPFHDVTRLLFHVKVFRFFVVRDFSGAPPPEKPAHRDPYPTLDPGEFF